MCIHVKKIAQHYKIDTYSFGHMGSGKSWSYVENLTACKVFITCSGNSIIGPSKRISRSQTQMEQGIGNIMKNDCDNPLLPHEEHVDLQYSRDITRLRHNSRSSSIATNALSVRNRRVLLLNLIWIMSYCPFSRKPRKYEVYISAFVRVISRMESHLIL